MKKENYSADKIVGEVKNSNNINASKQILEHTNDQLEKERTMKLSVKEGSACSVMSGLGDSYISPFALAIGANNLQIGLLSSFAGLLGPASQIIGTKLVEKYSRKRIIFIWTALQGLMWFPIMLLAIFFMKGIFTQYLPTILVIFYSIYAIFGSIGGPAWFSLLGDIVPKEHRGRYFSMRNRICGSVSLFSMLIGGFVLDYYKTRGYILVVFSIFFLIAGLFRLISAFSFRRHYEPKLNIEKNYYFSFFQFIKRAPFNNFGRFTFFVAFISLATQVAGPFFTVYMLKDLQFSYITFTLVNAAASVFTLLTITAWGRFSDKYGNRETMRIGSILVTIVPLLWLISPSPYVLIFIVQLVSGIGWAGFNLSAGNFIYDAVTPQRRALCVSYYNLVNGIGVFIGGLIGGLLATYVHFSFIKVLFFVFIVSSLLRLIATLFLLPKIKEVRVVSKPSPHAFLHFVSLMPIREKFFDFGHIIEKAGKKGRAFFGR